MESYNKESDAVKTHLSFLQSIITRMAENSFKCKGWAITICSAILVLFIQNDVKNNMIWITVIPMSMFFVLDSYYLALEKHFRDKYNELVSHLSKKLNGVKESEVYKISGPGVGSIAKNLLLSLISPSIFLFYLCFIILIIILYKLFT